MGSRHQQLLICASRTWLDSAMWYNADPEYLAFIERLNADPQPESKPEAPAAATKGQNKPVTALMAFLQEQHARKKHGAVIAARSRRDRGKEPRAAPVGLSEVEQ